MQGTRHRRIGAGFALAPWLIAGGLLVAAGVPVAAQEATPPAEVAAEGTLPTAGDAAAADAAAPADAAEASDVAVEVAPAADSGGRGGRGGQQDIAAVPATGVGSGASDLETTVLSIGLAVSAAATGAAAIRGRFDSR